MVGGEMMRVTLVLAVCLSSMAQAGTVEYVGSFNLPPWRSNPNGGAAPRWGYGTLAMVYDPDADALVGSSHTRFVQVAWASIPPIGARAGEIRPFRGILGDLGDRSEFRSVPRLDRIGGLAIVDDRLWVSFYTYYAVQSFERLDKPSFMTTSLNLDDPRGLYKPGPYGDPLFSQKRTSNYLFTFPKDFADEFLGGRRLGAGKGDGPGQSGNSHGPPIYAISTEPGPDGVLDAILLVNYPPGEDIFPDWSPCDIWEGAVWAQGSVVVAGRRGRGAPCYGKPDDCGGNRCERSKKGYHCDPYGVDLCFFSGADLALSAIGERDPKDVLPYKILDVTQHLKNICSYHIGALAYDTLRDRLYLVQQNGENPIVHVWQFSKPGFSVSVEVGGKKAEFKGETEVDAVAQAIEHLADILRKEKP